jgi:hypothetical protein
MVAPGASFFYHVGSPVPYEAFEVRAFGLLLHDMVRRLETASSGAEASPLSPRSVHQDLSKLVEDCIGSSAAQRPRFGSVFNRLTVLERRLGPKARNGVIANGATG